MQFNGVTVNLTSLVGRSFMVILGRGYLQTRHRKGKFQSRIMSLWIQIILVNA